MNTSKAYILLVGASLASASKVMINPCLNATFAALPFCNASLDLPTRVEDAISRMTLEEKIGALGTSTPAIESLGLAEYNWWSEASSGVASADSIKTTKFAFPITTGMSFNRTMWFATGAQIGREARAAMNAGLAYSTFWAPVVNLAREPRWGRNIEVPSEDPYQSGEYATAFVKGFQEAPEDPYHVQASACCKHFVANSMESSTEVGVHHDRNHVNSDISMQDLVDSYMLPFQACVEKGRVTSLMCSYNAVNGVPSCANDWLLGTVARDNWGFDGYVTSDCDADNDVFVSHHYTATAEEAVRDVLRAGTDVDCGGFVQKNAQSTLDKKLITEDDIDERLKMLFKVRMRLSHFDPVGPLQGIPESTICSDYAIELSHDGVRQSATLLKNAGSALPLSKDTKSVVVIGPNALLSQATAGYYGPANHCLDAFTLVDTIKAVVPNTTTVPGVPSVSSEDTSGIAAAVAAAKDADTVVLAVGTDLTWAHEGGDAKTIIFTDAQSTLIREVSAAAQKPVTLVLFTANPLDLTDVLANDKIGAVLHVGQPSVTIMGAGDVLFGDVSPAGRMVQTVHKREYQDQISIFDFGMRPGPSPYPRPDCNETDVSKCTNGTNPGRTYRFFTGQAVVPFGFGLSYTTFKYEVVSAPTALSLGGVRDMVSRNEHVAFPSLSENIAAAQYTVNVTNTGGVDADEVVLGFVTPPGAGQNGVPLKSLFGFERVHVKAGETVQVTLYPSLNDLTAVGADGGRSVLEGKYTFSFGVSETVPHGGAYAEHVVGTSKTL